MLRIRRAADRGHLDHGWLDTWHTFSFGDYRDPAHTRFRTLRVINDDRVAPGRGFGMHPHRDMEILTYVLDGAVAHEDSGGNRGVIERDGVQVMSAGRGVEHSEFNASRVEPVHLLQIWIFPEEKGLEPGYAERVFPADEKRGRLRAIASRDGREDSLIIHQDAAVYATILDDPDQTVEHTLAPGRGAWVQVARGSVIVNGERLETGDGAAIEDEEVVTLRAAADSNATDEPAEALLFDLG
ncbi:MAG: pirin family protein [Phycisphaerales bacterium]